MAGFAPKKSLPGESHDQTDLECKVEHPGYNQTQIARLELTVNFAPPEENKAPGSIKDVASGAIAILVFQIILAMV